MHQSFEALLEKNAASARLLAHARLLQKLALLYDAAAPAGLAHVSRVANYKSGIVVLHADNGAVAAKLRQMSLRLGEAFRMSGLQFSGLEIKVQPRKIASQSITSTVKPLSARAGAVLQATATAMPTGSPLRISLEHLLARAEVLPPPAEAPRDKPHRA